MGWFPIAAASCPWYRVGIMLHDHGWALLRINACYDWDSHTPRFNSVAAIAQEHLVYIDVCSALTFQALPVLRLSE